MTGMLASVNNVDEVRVVLDAKVDIIDFKDPKTGALGALVPESVQQLVEFINGRCLSSCTIGDLPMQAETIYSATLMMVKTGVDYVKIGFFPDGDSEQVLDKLASLTRCYRLIAVLFADKHPDFGLIDKLHTVGFSGIMLDTADKSQGTLTEIMSLAEISRFVNAVNSKKMLCGLAGSLQCEDIVGLLSLKPDYLGFRGALCHQNDRLDELNLQSIIRIKQAIIGNI